MSKFKVGAKIRCVDNSKYHNHLTVGKVYTVLHEDTDPRYVRIKPDHGLNEGGYKVDRFELVESKPKFKVGDAVRCVRDMSNLTIGRVYTVVSVCSENYWYRVINDLGAKVGYEADFFELVQKDAVLTPEEVFEHLRKGTKLQHLVGTYGWKDVTTPEELYYTDICSEPFRIKPEPEVIELNGKKYREIID